jgi:hypothetical protein
VYLLITSPLATNRGTCADTSDLDASGTETSGAEASGAKAI